MKSARFVLTALIAAVTLGSAAGAHAQEWPSKPVKGIDVSGAPPAALDAFVRKEIARWAKVVKDNGIKFGD